MFYALGGSETLVKRFFVHHDLDMRYTETLTGTQTNARCTKPAQAQKKI